MAKLFPIGTISSGSSVGTMDGINYYMFEPNGPCHSNVVSNVLTTLFQDQTILSRKKAFPYLIISYEYENILNREFNQIEHFIYDVNDGVDSFYAIDFSKGENPTSVTIGASAVVNISNTRYYSLVTHYKANYAFLWSGSAWLMGPVTSITTNTSITFSKSYGSLASDSGSIVYPVYEVRLTPGVLTNFKSVIYFDDKNITTSGSGGYMRSGTITFNSKYKV